MDQKNLGNVIVFKIVQCCQNDTFPGNYKTIITKLRNWTKITDNQVLKAFPSVNHFFCTIRRSIERAMKFWIFNFVKVTRFYMEKPRYSATSRQTRLILNKSIKTTFCFSTLFFFIWLKKHFLRKNYNHFFLLLLIC